MSKKVIGTIVSTLLITASLAVLSVSASDGITTLGTPSLTTKGIVQKVSPVTRAKVSYPENPVTTVGINAKPPIDGAEVTTCMYGNSYTPDSPKREASMDSAVTSVNICENPDISKLTNINQNISIGIAESVSYDVNLIGGTEMPHNCISFSIKNPTTALGTAKYTFLIKDENGAVVCYLPQNEGNFAEE